MYSVRVKIEVSNPDFETILERIVEVDFPEKAQSLIVGREAFMLCDRMLTEEMEKNPDAKPV